MHDSEVDYTIGAILANPLGMKAHGDKYLKGLYKGDNNLLVVDDRISGVCLSCVMIGVVYLSLQHVVLQIHGSMTTSYVRFGLIH
jgi:urea transporter